MRFPLSILLVAALAVLAEDQNRIVPSGSGGGAGGGRGGGVSGSAGGGGSAGFHGRGGAHGGAGMHGAGGVHGAGGFHGGYMGGGGPAPSGRVVHMRQVPVSHPSPIVNQSHFVHDNRRVAFPTHDAGGHAITRPAATMPPSHHAGIVRNEAVVRDIRGHERLERQAGRYYWHDVHGVRYSHYYDHYGVHWYGFYVGPSFYWTRWWGNRWWWYDPIYFHWVYWYGGYWWWQRPDGLVYVYVDNNYYPYDEVAGGVTVADSEALQPATERPPSPNAGKAFYSPDGRRMIQLFGDRGEAFLYDITREEPRFLTYLASSVSNARFTGGTRERPLQILLDFKDGSFALFDDKGRALSGTPEAEKPLKATPAPPAQPETAPAKAAPKRAAPVEPPPTPEPGEIPGTPPAQDQ